MEFGTLSQLKGNKLMIIAIVVVCVLALGGSVYMTKKWHNPVEQEAAAIIDKETGIDVDKLLPPDK